MPEVIEITVYKFEELSDRAKEKARQWWREASSQDEWWESTYEDVARCAEILGINLRQRPVKLLGGGTRYEPEIYFSGFWSQGDGAQFGGTYSYPKRRRVDDEDKFPVDQKKGLPPHKLIRAYAPQDEALHRIADDLQDLQRRFFYRLYASVKTCGRGAASYNTTIEVTNCKPNGDDDVSREVEEEVRDALRAFMDWIYRSLEKEYEWLNSDEQVDESIMCNEYTFDADGNLAP